MAANISTYAVSDRYGNDPLKHKLLSQLDSITSYIEHTVRQSEESNPQLIAFDYFGDVEMFFVILAYNGICDGMSIEPGQRIRIPEPSQVTALVKRTNASTNKVTL